MRRHEKLYLTAHVDKDSKPRRVAAELWNYFTEDNVIELETRSDINRPHWMTRTVSAQAAETNYIFETAETKKL